MNERESYLTQRATDFPLLAQFLYPQPDSSPAPAAPLIDALAAVLGDVVTSSPPLFANLARRTLSDLCRLRSVSSLSNIIDSVEREFRMEPGTLQSRCKTQRIALARQVAYYLCRTITLSRHRRGAGPTPHIGHSRLQPHSLTLPAAPFRSRIEKMQRHLLAPAVTTIAAAAWGHHASPAKPTDRPGRADYERAANGRLSTGKYFDCLPLGRARRITSVQGRRLALQPRVTRRLDGAAHEGVKNGGLSAEGQTMITLAILCLVAIILLALGLGMYEHGHAKARKRARELEIALHNAFERGELWPTI
jgi:hypothetical protein